MNDNAYRVPLFIPIIIVLVLGAMFYYAAFLDVPDPEETVVEFYEAYFDKDYQTAASNMSVFWASQFLPQYSGMTSQELLAKGDDIRQATADFFTLAEKQSPPLTDMKITVDPEYSKTGEYAALVVYKLENSEMESLEMAMLIKETDRFYIINIYAMEEEFLQNVKDFDIALIDADFKALLEK